MTVRAFVCLLACLALTPAVGAPAKWCTVLVFEPQGGILLGGQPTSIGPDLDRRLTAIAHSLETHRICISAVKESKWGEVAAGLTAIQKAGLYINMTGSETHSP